MENLKLDWPSETIARLTLSQPSKRNAVSAAMWSAIPEQLGAIMRQTPRVLIVTGEGDHFSAGADISEFGTLYSDAESSRAISADISAAMRALAELPIPTIAMIRGSCIGGGLALALCCDIRMADNQARFAITPARLGLSYPFEDIVRLVDAVGQPNAADLLFSARLVKAKRAARMGLINRVAKADDLSGEVMDYAQTLAGLSGESQRTMKRLLAQVRHGQRVEDDETRTLFTERFTSKDFKAGYTAFMSKQKPQF